MSLELILWLSAWIVLSEIIFIWSLIKFGTNGWFMNKFVAFGIGMMLIWIQMVILNPSNFSCVEGCSLFPQTYNWINILYEVLIILGVFLFFQFNKLMVRMVDKNE